MPAQLIMKEGRRAAQKDLGRRPYLRDGAMRNFFKRLKEEKNVKLERVAVDLDISVATVAAWKYEYRQPHFTIVQYLEKLYGMKIK